MTLTVRLPHRVEQQLAEYCVKRSVTKSTAVKRALEELMNSEASGGDDLKHPFIGGDRGDGADVSGNVKATLRERFNPRRR